MKKALNTEERGHIPENSRLDLADALAIADHDCRTKGILVVMVAPTSEGWSRDVVLAHGDLDVDPVLAHVFDLTTRALHRHAARQTPGARP